MPSVRHLYLSPGHNYFGRHGMAAGEHEVVSVESVECVAGRGIVGDRFFDYKPDYKGQITLFSLEVFADLLTATGAPAATSPAAVRRNLFTEGIDLNTLVGREFTVGPVRLLGVEECKPCYWMDSAVGPGAELSLKGRGGLRCKILTSGTIRAGDPLTVPTRSFAGILLAGGRSSRMGEDKAFIGIDGETLLARNLRLLREAGCAPVVLSGRREVSYPVGAEVPVVYDAIGEGPAAGILAGMAAAADAAFVAVVAVDMPALDAAWFRSLLAQTAPGVGVVAERDGRLEPLAAIYPAAFADFLRERVKAGEFALHRIVREAVSAGLMRTIPVPESRSGLFSNWNTPEDRPATTTACPRPPSPPG